MQVSLYKCLLMANVVRTHTHLRSSEGLAGGVFEERMDEELTYGNIDMADISTSASHQTDEQMGVDVNRRSLTSPQKLILPRMFSKNV